MDINIIIIIIEKMQQNLRYFNLFFFFFLNSITPYDITEYCIVGLKTIYSNVKFFIFQLICIVAKMVITFAPVGIFSCGFRCCTQENKFYHLNQSFFLRWGLFNSIKRGSGGEVTKVRACRAWSAGRGLLAAGQHKSYVSPAKIQISLHLCEVLPESLPGAIYEPRIQRFFSEDADQTTRTAYRLLGLRSLI